MKENKLKHQESSRARGDNNIYIVGRPEGEKRGHRNEQGFEERTAENLLNLLKDSLTGSKN